MTSRSDIATLSRSPDPAPRAPARTGSPPRRGGRRLRRSDDSRVVSGVAGGIGALLGVDPLLVRAAFVALTAAGGAGVLLYVVAWAVSAEPLRAGAASASPAATGTPRRGLAVGLVVLGSMLILRDAGIWFGDALAWPIALGAAGSAVIWARSEEGERRRWGGLGGRLSGDPLAAVAGGRAGVVRVLGGALLVALGMGTFLVTNQALSGLREGLLAMMVTAAGLGLIGGPWLYRLARQVSDERRQRIRSEERAEMAAHLHDSVLHTLALIQRTSAPPEVVALARTQERELRAWLQGRAAPSSQATLRAAVDAVATRVEHLHHVTVDTVVVGDDAPADERITALVMAVQEAATNAARHSGVAEVSIYVEVEPDTVTAFVRDRGRGFDPDDVPDDRHGIRESVVGRLRRHGGTARIVSAPGEGTEVELQVPRTAS